MLQARDLRLSYGTTRAVDGVSLHVSAGEVVGILGPNGAGKSTVARMLLGLAAPDEGDVLVDDAPLASLDVAARARKIAAVLQDQGPKFSFSVRDVVALAREARRPMLQRLDASDARAVTHALEAADVAHLADRSFDALSGGERQRVLLARALAQETRYLVLDEPTAFLDLHHRYAFADRIRALANAVGIVWILHDLDLALRDCDRIYVLAAGKLVAEGKPLDVLTKSNLRLFFGVDAELHRDESGRGHVLVGRPV